MKTNGKIAILLVTLVLAVPVLAQEADQSSAATLAELRVEAQRLTALAQVPETGRAEAEALLARADALTERERAQEIARLRAYIAALPGGDSPAVAEEVAASAVGATSVELAREREALQADIEAFIDTYPEAAGVFRRAAFAAHGIDVFEFGPMGLPDAFESMRGRLLQVRPGRGPAGGLRFTLPFDFQFPGLPLLRPGAPSDQ